MFLLVTHYTLEFMKCHDSFRWQRNLNCVLSLKHMVEFHLRNVLSIFSSLFVKIEKWRSQIMFLHHCLNLCSALWMHFTHAAWERVGQEAEKSQQSLHCCIPLQVLDGWKHRKSSNKVRIYFTTWQRFLLITQCSFRYLRDNNQGC